MTPSSPYGPGHATEIVTELGATANSLNTTQADGIIVVGGDGLVLEVITGLMQLSEDNRLRNIPLAIAPGGTANAYSNMLYPGDCSSRRCLARRCAHAILDGSQGHVDVMEVLKSLIFCVLITGLQIDNTDNEKEDKMFALSLIGWGLSGSIAKRAEKLRWMPGHRHYRYDLAGGVSLVKDWPAFGTATLRYRRPGSEDWETKEISIANFLAATVPTLGKGRPFSVDKSLDDGTVVLSMVPKNVSRYQVVKMLSGMKKGRTLSESPLSETLRVSEFQLITREQRPPLLIDGDSFKCGTSVHVKVLPKFVRVFALDDALLETSVVPTSPASDDSGVVLSRTSSCGSQCKRRLLEQFNASSDSSLDSQLNSSVESIPDSCIEPCRPVKFITKPLATVRAPRQRQSTYV